MPLMDFGRGSNVIDFYVRLAAQQLGAMVLTHLESCIDTYDQNEPTPREFNSACAPPSIRGFTEWGSQFPSAASVGWDWVLTGPRQLELDRNSIRTNLMLVDANGKDCGQEATVLAVTRLIEQTPWQAVVLQAVRQHFERS